MANLFHTNLQFLTVTIDNLAAVLNVRNFFPKKLFGQMANIILGKVIKFQPNILSS